jgi:virginiamycin B lyase
MKRRRPATALAFACFVATVADARAAQSFANATAGVSIVFAGVSPSTRSVGARFTSGTGSRLLVIALDPRTDPACHVSAAGTSCTLRFALAAGSYAADVAAYDGPIGRNRRPTGALLAANHDARFTTAQATIPITLFGIPASGLFVPQPGGRLGGSQFAGFTFPIAATSLQRLNFVALDADGNAIVGPAAPQVSLATTDSSVTVTHPIAATTFFQVQKNGHPPAGHAAKLIGVVTPAPASGAAKLALELRLTFTDPFASGRVTIEPYPVSLPRNQLISIAAGPDDALWFTGIGASSIIGRAAPGQAFREYAVAAPPEAIALGADGALWFTQSAPAEIGRMTTQGAVSEYPLAAGSSSIFPSIALGSDGALWFVDSSGRIDRITTGGSLSSFPIPTGSAEPLGIAAGPDGALWFTENGENKIGRITTYGAVTEFTLPGPIFSPNSIAAGPDGALWFTCNDQFNGAIGRITTRGAATYWAIESSSFPVVFDAADQIAAGPEGNLWFTVDTGMVPDYIGSTSTEGSQLLYPIPQQTPNGAQAVAPSGIAPGPDGAMWFTETLGGGIGRAL